MKERIKTILLIFSLAINLGILGFLAYSWGTSYLQERREKLVYPEEVTALSQPQTEEIARARRNLVSSIMERGQEMQGKREELIDLLMEPVPDPQAVNMKIREINQLQGNIQECVVDQMLFETRKMTPGQRVHYFTSIRNRMCQRGMMGMGMPGRGSRCGRGSMMGRW